AVAAVAVQAGWTLLGPSWTRAGKAGRARRVRLAGDLLAGGAAAATIGPWLVLVLLGGGLAELALRWPRDDVPVRGGRAGERGGKGARPPGGRRSASGG